MISRSDPMHVCSEPEEGCTRVLEANEAEIGAKVESVSDHGERFSVNYSPDCF